MSESTTAPQVPLLDAIQARVLGCLVEKQATTPDVYPLTVNAVQLAANQKTAREPLMSLELGEVHRALRLLGELGLVRQQFSSRSERYEHRLEEALGLPRQQTVLISLLLVRGPQTVQELLARSERLLRFADPDEVRHHLDRLIRRELAIVLPRSGGQREDRYMHLLAGPVDVTQWATASAAAPSERETGLEARVQTLEAQIARLQEQVEELLSARNEPGAS
ncbi:MAG TPA: DUF480 domain-containing protein [Stenotrophomonas sp.]